MTVGSEKMVGPITTINANLIKAKDFSERLGFKIDEFYGTNLADGFKTAIVFFAIGFEALHSDPPHPIS
jgi:hypothetical protein